MSDMLPPNDEPIAQYLTKKVLDSQELRQLIDQRAEMMIREKEFPGLLTRAQLAKAWQISKQTIDRMTDDEIAGYGFRRKKIGVAVRFERISPREVFNRTKKIG
jgi:hypothetical protein